MDLKLMGVGERDALLDLLVLGMYADGHLARVEDARIERLLHAMGWTAKSDRDRELDASVTRVRKYAESPALVAEHAATLAKSFLTEGDRVQALKWLDELLGADDQVTAGESKFLEVARRAFASR